MTRLKGQWSKYVPCTEEVFVDCLQIIRDDSIGDIPNITDEELKEFMRKEGVENFKGVPTFREMLARMGYKRREYTLKTAKRAVLIAAATCIMITAGAAFAFEPVREKVFELLRIDYISYSSVQVEAQPDDNETIQEIYLPEYIPEGYEIDAGNSYASDYMRVTCYANNKTKNCIYLVQKLKHESEYFIDAEESTINKIELSNGIKGFISENEKAKMLMAVNNKYVFTIVSTDTEVDIAKIAESLKND